MAREEGFFDELARGLADGSLTRGKALRLMGAAVVGGTLGSLGIGEAGADAPGCKRIGKHCTRNDQCCGSLVCVSGTCQTQTTTPTPTTSTTETPTTSTTTTTCSGLPNGATCTINTDCCSGRCARGPDSGMCAEPCQSGRVLLSNGTCALPCGRPGDPPCSACGNLPEGSCVAAESGGTFCRGDVVALCGPGGFCPTGQFCFSGSCVVAC